MRVSDVNSAFWMPVPNAAANAILEFIEDNNIETLNVAGPRASGWSGGYRFALGVVGAVVSNLQGGHPGLTYLCATIISGAAEGSGYVANWCTSCSCRYFRLCGGYC